MEKCVGSPALRVSQEGTGLEELLANLEGAPFDTVTEQTDREYSASWLDRLP